MAIKRSADSANHLGRILLMANGTPNKGTPVLGDYRRRSTLKSTMVISVKKTAALCRGAHPFTLAAAQKPSLVQVLTVTDGE